MKYNKEKIYEIQSSIVKEMFEKTLNKIEDINLLPYTTFEKHIESSSETIYYLEKLMNIPRHLISKEYDIELAEKISDIGSLTSINMEIFNKEKYIIISALSFIRANLKGKKNAKENLNIITLEARLKSLDFLIKEISTSIKDKYKNDDNYISKFKHYIKQIKTDLKDLSKNKKYLTEDEKQKMLNYKKDFKVFRTFHVSKNSR